MHKDTGLALKELRVDGGPTRNGYLMQMQSDLLDAKVLIPSAEELSGIGAAYMAGLTCGVYTDGVFGKIARTAFCPTMDERTREKKLLGWKNAVSLALCR